MTPSDPAFEAPLESAPGFDGPAEEPVSRPVGLWAWQGALADARGMSLALRGALSLMASYATTATGGDIRPSLRRISERTGVSRSALSRHIADAVALGWLERVEDHRADGEPSVYRLSTPVALADRGCTPLRQGVSHMGSGIRQGVSSSATPPVSESDTTYPPTYPTTCPDTYPGTCAPTYPDLKPGACSHADYCGDALCGLEDFTPPD